MKRAEMSKREKGAKMGTIALLFFSSEKQKWSEEEEEEDEEEEGVVGTQRYGFEECKRQKEWVGNVRVNSKFEQIKMVGVGPGCQKKLTITREKCWRAEFTRTTIPPLW